MERNLSPEMTCKYVETVGPNLQQLLFKKDPWKSECGRQDCLPCGSKPGDCTKKSVVYRIRCQVCHVKGESATYYGESSRTAYERALEHQDLMEARSLESPMVEHHQEVHPEEELKVSMEVVGHEPRPLNRKTLEGVLISEHTGGTLMNRRGEWGENLPPKFGVLGRDEEEEGTVRNRKRAQGRQEDTVDARPVKKRRETPITSEGTQSLHQKAEPSTTQKSQRSQKPLVDVQYGSMHKFIIKPIKSKTKLGKQETNTINFRNINQLSLPGPIIEGSQRPAERETKTEVINVGAHINKSRRDKLPDS